MMILFFSRSKVLLSLFFLTSFFSGCLRSDSAEQKSLDISSVSFDEQTYPVVIIGGGMAGLTAAVYCSQANIPCLVIEGPKPGGALGQSHSVRNWPGVEQAPGADIVGSVRKQAVAGGVKIINQKVTGVQLNQWPRIIQAQDLYDSSKTNTIKALTVIIAMGTEPNLLGIPGEKENWGIGVSNCAVCEGSLYKGKNVVIVGGGDAAITEADYLADIAKKVTIFVRKDYFRAKDIKAKEKTLALPNVEVMYNTEVTKVINDGSKVSSLVICNNAKNEESDFAVDGLFLAIGSRPNTALFKDQLELDRNGFIVLKKNQETSIKGVYAGGDVSDYEFVQAVTASSDGCKSALQAIKFLKESGFDKSMLALKKESEIEVQKEIPSSVEPSSKPEPAKAPITTSTTTKSITKNSVVSDNEVTEILSTKDFDSLVLKSDKPVVLDLFTTYCGPCKAMMPVVEKLADSFAGKVRFLKLNASSKTVDADLLISKLGPQPLKSVPTFIFANKSKEVDRFVGTASFEEFKKKIAVTFKVK